MFSEWFVHSSTVNKKYRQKKENQLQIIIDYLAIIASVNLNRRVRVKREFIVYRLENTIRMQLIFQLLVYAQRLQFLFPLFQQLFVPVALFSFVFHLFVSFLLLQKPRERSCNKTGLTPTFHKERPVKISNDLSAFILIPHRCLSKLSFTALHPLVV